MQIAVIGTGFIGSTLGRAFAAAGQGVTFGSRHPGNEAVADATSATVTSVAAALARSDVIVLALPGAAVAGLTAEHGTCSRASS